MSSRAPPNKNWARMFAPSMPSIMQTKQHSYAPIRGEYAFCLHIKDTDLFAINLKISNSIYKHII